MATKIEIVIQHALRTFSKYLKRVPDFTQTDIHHLRSLTEELTFTDIQNQGSTISKDLAEFLRNKKNPLDYLSVYEDDCITVGVFLLKEGAKLPIHDHPNMYGIIKVLEGILKVTSYTVNEFDKTVVSDDQSLFYNSPLKVTKHPEILLGNQDLSCLLTPTDKNIHEVECVVGPAAFLDILSPPYEEGEADAPRSCHYFEEIQSEDNILRNVFIDPEITP